MYLASAVNKPKKNVSKSSSILCATGCSHLDGAHRAQVGLEDILQPLARTDIDLESFAPPLRPVSLVAPQKSSVGRHTRDSALGLRSWAADILAACDYRFDKDVCRSLTRCGLMARARSSVASKEVVGKVGCHFFLPGRQTQRRCVDPSSRTQAAPDRVMKMSPIFVTQCYLM